MQITFDPHFLNKCAFHHNFWQVTIAYKIIHEKQPTTHNS